MSRVMPPWIGTTPPHTPEPPPYGMMGTPMARAARTMVATSRTVSGHTTACGRWAGGAPARRANSSRGHMSRA